MNRIMILTKLFLKDLNGLNKDSKKGSKLKSIGMYIFLIVAFLPIALATGEMTSNMYDLFSKINQEGVLLALNFTNICLIIFVFAFLNAMSIFYFSTDIEFILPLPFKPKEIIGSKFIVALITEYFVEAIVYLPVFFVYGVRSGANFIYYLYGILLFITLPVLPLVFATIICMLIMSFTDIVKDKDRFKKIAGMIGLFLGLGINVVFQKMGRYAQDSEKMNQLVNASKNSLINKISSIFPTAKFASLSMVNHNSMNGFINLIIYFIITIISVCIFLYLADKLYFKGVLGITEVSKKKKKISKESLNKSFKQDSLTMACLKNEMRTLFRNPTYFQGCVVSSFIWPIFFVIPLITGGSDAIQHLRIFVSNEGSLGIVVSIAFAGMLFAAGSNSIAATSISREGKNIILNRFLPIDNKVKIKSKVLSSVIMAAVSIFLFLIIATFMLKLPIKVVIILIALSVLAIFYGSLFGVILDLKHPKLDWETEEKALNRNLNSFIAMLVSMASIAIYLPFIFKYDLTSSQSIILIVGIFGALDLILYIILSKKGSKWMDKLKI